MLGSLHESINFRGTSTELQLSLGRLLVVESRFEKLRCLFIRSRALGIFVRPSVIDVFGVMTARKRPVGSERLVLLKMLTFLKRRQTGCIESAGKAFQVFEGFLAWRVNRV